MTFIPRMRQTVWTHHARAKMAFYRLSEQRVARVLHSPRRVEEGVAPKTVAMMQPVSVRTRAEAVMSKVSHDGAKPSRGTSLRFGSNVQSEEKNAKPKESWSQEIWVMVQDIGKERKIVSAWRYPGMTRPKDAAAMDVLRREYREFLAKKD